ncbi:hypothetical protein M378DRAFT_156210 [Amanita muscaria Koide BX008]|uniref:Uncharacterized protein n=1 Tax=Amanita muscaria (strain Koide BX008) TaxID=946122 RepID=A0A0C2TS82_AMAMK|nr:hypothetical protein M378DRAFT_156210 [Amanita muscaria Koide BX008]
MFATNYDRWWCVEHHLPQTRAFLLFHVQGLGVSAKIDTMPPCLILHRVDKHH